MREVVAVVLAAGKGTRMKSQLPKVLHNVGGLPMVQHVLNVAKAAGASRLVTIVGFEGDKVVAALGNLSEYVEQKEQLGTGHALMQAKPVLDDFSGTILLLCGDTPLLTPQTLERLIGEHRQTSCDATVLTAILDDPAGYGRIIRNGVGNVTGIIEQKDASDTQKQIKEINTGMYCFEAKAVFGALDSLTCNNAQGEYYLTDVLAILAGQGKKVGALVVDDFEETLGINSRVQLAAAEQILRQRKRLKLMESGVTLIDPCSTFIDSEVEIGPDTIVYPFTWIEGKTVIGTNCQIGPSTRISDSFLGDNVTVHFSYAHECEMADGVTVGPYAHIRPQTKMDKGVKVGNFVEIKNTIVGSGSKVPHLSYVGDTDMGSGVNIGSGTITVNYDGKKKHRTIIEDDAFIGCNTNLVAPVTVGSGAYVAAGSTITKNVPPGSLGVGRARQSNIEGWADKLRSK